MNWATAAPISFVIGVVVGLVLCSQFHLRIVRRSKAETQDQDEQGGDPG